MPGLPEQPCPDAVILGYPVITAGEYAHRGSFVQLAGEDLSLIHISEPTRPY